MNQDSIALSIQLEEAKSALALIACPPRADGSYNRCRQACEVLARTTLQKILQAEAASAKQRISGAPAPTTSNFSSLPANQLAPAEFICYTDGGCKGNPGPAGWGIRLLRGEEVLLSEGGFIGEATNQVAELQAAIEGLKRTPAESCVTLVSDSQYVLNGISTWRAGWEAKGMRTSTNKPVVNLEYWRELYALVDARKVTTQWVKGHSGNPHNEACDQLATQAIEQNTFKKDELWNAL